MRAIGIEKSVTHKIRYNSSFQINRLNIKEQISPTLPTHPTLPLLT